jgi:adenine C2-methylase RlmN of 23S rRNA A2503 and tRNA A37
MCDCQDLLYKILVIVEKIQDRVNNLEKLYDNIKKKQKQVDLIKLYNLKPQTEYEQ